MPRCLRFPARLEFHYLCPCACYSCCSCHHFCPLFVKYQNEFLTLHGVYRRVKKKLEMLGKMRFFGAVLMMRCAEAAIRARRPAKRQSGKAAKLATRQSATKTVKCNITFACLADFWKWPY